MYRPSAPQKIGGASGQTPVLIASHVGDVATNSPATSPAAGPDTRVVNTFMTMARPIPESMGTVSATQSWMPKTV